VGGGLCRVGRLLCRVGMLPGMVLWVVVVFIVLSATLILALTYGPMKAAANVRVIRSIAAVQYAAAAALAGARIAGIA
jgi:hypothetical protein